ncbi:MAG: tetratricopeptide repeat protein [Bacteroidales bacterium]|jgi:tetratricopeptide (TPR) repeat protein|nr:tetratricopeptide repeat protein [Bacteroidales bacterium]
MSKTFEEKYKEIRLLIDKELIGEAKEELDKIIQEDNLQEMAYYLKGNLYKKEQNWKDAINNYTKAIEINPSSVAKQARDMCIEILKFYNTDMYNH